MTNSGFSFIFSLILKNFYKYYNLKLFHLLLLFQPDDRGTCKKRDRQHKDKRNRISIQCKVYGKIGICKKAVDTYHAEKSGKNAVTVTGGMLRDQQERQDIDQRDVRRIAAAGKKDQEGQRCCRQQKKQGIYAVVGYFPYFFIFHKAIIASNLQRGNIRSSKKHILPVNGGTDQERME